MINIGSLSDFTEREADSVLGAKIIGIDSQEYYIVLKLDNGYSLEVSGSSYGDCALQVSCEEG